MRAGKIPSKMLKECVFPFLGAPDSDVFHGPGIGRDAALIQVGNQVMVASTDPITGAVHNIGAYAVHICANDIATFGIRPRWFLTTILLPEDSNAEELREIMMAMDETAQGLGVAIIGGHSEITMGISRPIVVGFMLGIADQGDYVTSTSAKADNILILTKGTAIEGTAILAMDRAQELQAHLDVPLIKRAQQFITKLSVVPEALAAMSTGAVTAMHDPTEGGVANGIHELADASELGFIIHRDALTIHEETREICRLLKINPLNLIASGAMLIAVQPEKADEVLTTLQRQRISATIIGKLVADSSVRVIVEPDGNRSPLPPPIEDALWQALEEAL